MNRFLKVCCLFGFLGLGIQASFPQDASKVDADSQYKMGMKYYFGDGVPKDEARGVKLFKMASGNGSAKAQTRLALAYSQGVGIDRNLKEAVKWFRKAADKGDMEAQTQLGFQLCVLSLWVWQ